MAITKEIFHKKSAAVVRHLDRVTQMLPKSSVEFLPNSDASDAVILHLWQALQIVLDLATALCIQLKLGTPSSYADVFVKFKPEVYLNSSLAQKREQITNFYNQVAHHYETLDFSKVYQIAKHLPQDLKDFLETIRKQFFMKNSNTSLIIKTQLLRFLR